MSGITNPAEPFFKDGLWAWDVVEKTWMRCENDPTTNQLQVAVTNAPEAAQDNPDHLRVGIYAWAATVWEKLVSSGGRMFTALHGWDGSAWHKLPMLFGYSDRWADTITDTAVGGESLDITTVAVDTGYIHVLQGASIRHDAAANKELRMYLWSGTHPADLFHSLAAVPATRYVWNGECVLKVGDKVRATLTAPGAGKSVWCYVWGYKMKIAE